MSRTDPADSNGVHRRNTASASREPIQLGEKRERTREQREPRRLHEVEVAIGECTVNQADRSAQPCRDVRRDAEQDTRGASADSP